MQAFYHALPLNYISASKLQSKLGGEANPTTVCKLMDKMTKEGYIEATNNRRLGNAPSNRFYRLGAWQCVGLAGCSQQKQPLYVFGWG